MKYLLLIYGDEKLVPTLTEAEMTQMLHEYGAFTQEIAQSGALKASEALQPTATATLVRVREGKTQTTDGPFAETKEQLGGFYLVEVPDLDAAIALAAKIPGAKHGAIEVRPVINFPM